MIVFFKGLVVGLLMCAPVGPIGLLCLRRTLANGAAAGLASYLGAALADGAYCAIAGFGVTFVSESVEHEELWLRIFGGVVLIVVGLRIVLSRSGPNRSVNDSQGLIHDFGSIFLITLANPFPLLVFTAVFAALGVGGWKGDYFSTAVLVAGVLAGSALWGPILVAGLSRFQPWLLLREKERYLLNLVAGSIIAAFGAAVALITLIHMAK
jgi:threonine/homoserine/homoserine lactone efflux protein